MSRDTFADIQPTKALIFIADKPLNFVSMRLEQSFGEHHTFSIKADFDALGNTFMNKPGEHLKLIGQPVDMDLRQGDDSAKAYLFRGIIQDVAFEGHEGRHGYLVINGASPTILMEKGKRYDVFSDQTLKQVVRYLTEDIINQKTDLPVYSNPVYTGGIDFLMQYNESDWQFLRRLSCIAKENMYWTGRDLVFGMHNDFPMHEATYDREITHFHFGSRFLPNRFTRYQYLPGTDETLTKESSDRIKGADAYVNTVHEESKIITEGRPARSPLELSVSDVGSLNDRVEHEKSGRASETVYIKGTSKTADPRIGRLLKIKMPDTMENAGELGTFRITKVTHEFRQNDRYTCEFEGIPAELPYYPLLEVETPVADSVPAKVVSNVDPDGQGRVQVDFYFADRLCDTWLRVMTPGAGLTRGKEKNRGMVFIPEKGDHVMVGFEFADPTRPYVMGSMFHGMNGQGGGENNKIKSIILSSGTKIIFNDDEGSVHIEVPSGSTYDMDGKGNIAVYAPKNITITAEKDISISAGENMIMDVGNDMIASVANNQTTNVGETIDTSANNKKETIDQNADVNIGEKMTLSTNETDMFANSGDFIMKSAGKALLQGDKDARISRG